MIQSKKDYIFYLKADEIALKKQRGTVQYYRDYLLDDIWRFERLLRKREFYINCKKGIHWSSVKKFSYLKAIDFALKACFKSLPLYMKSIPCSSS